MSVPCVTLWHRSYGGGQVCVFLHGLLGSSENWHSVAEALADEWKCVVPDLRNHGRSPHAPEHSYGAMANDLGELLDLIEVRRCLLVGHSMGGKVAMRFALDNPSRVEGLVIEDVIPGATSPQYLNYLNALIELRLDTITSRRAAEEQLSGDVPDTSMRQFLLKNLERVNGRYRWRANLRGLKDSYDEIWGAIEPTGSYGGPALFVKGSESDVVSGQRAATVRDFFPQAQIESVEGAGHWIHATHFERFLSLIRNFTRALDR